jgi:hypothetical protein
MTPDGSPLAPLTMVYGTEAVLPPEIYHELARVAHFNPEDRAEAREHDANLLEERRNIALSNVHKYQAALKRCYNKSVVQRELNIGDLVLKKDIYVTPCVTETLKKVINK